MIRIEVATVTVNGSTRAVAGLLAIGALFAACSAADNRHSASPVALPSAPIADPSATLEPSITVAPSDSPTDEAPTPGPPMPEPPAASIAVEGGDPVVGQLGSFTWQNGGSDSPWLPGSPIHVAGGEQLVLALAEPVPLANWTVSRTPASAFGTDIVGMAEGSSATVRFDAPPSGSWSVSVSVWFADNLGDATYYWRIDVD